MRCRKYILEFENEVQGQKVNYISNGFPGSSLIKNLPANAGDAVSIPGLEQFPREGNGNPLQYSFLENSMDRGDWQATVHGVTRVRHDLMTKQWQIMVKCWDENSLDILGYIKYLIKNNLTFSFLKCREFEDYIRDSYVYGTVLL